MITMIQPERGGESLGILRVEITLPISPDELESLRDWFDQGGWSIEVGQIDDFLDDREYFGGDDA